MSRKVSAVDARANATKVTLLTVPTKNTGIWTTMYVISTAGTETPKVFWYDASTNTEYLVIGGKNLGVGEYILLADKEVVLQAGDEIRIQNAGSNSVTYIATVEFIPETTVQFQF